MFTYFHICTHETNNSILREDTLTSVIVNEGNPMDLLIRGATVLEVLEVRVIRYHPRSDSVQLEYDSSNINFIYDHPAKEYAYYDGAHHYYQDYSQFFEPGEDKSNPLPSDFYELVLKNRLQWLVEPPIEYEVIMRVRYDREFKQQYSIEDCDICQGNGWFVDILNNDGLFEADRGVIKVVQRVVKDLLTELFSSLIDLEYGTKLKKMVMLNAIDETELFDDIMLVVREVEVRYMQRQVLEYDTLPPEERLESLIIQKLYRRPDDPRKIVLELRIITEEEDAAFALRI